jgi:hypothetical protein
LLLLPRKSILTHQELHIPLLDGWTSRLIPRRSNLPNPISNPANHPLHSASTNSPSLTHHLSHRLWISTEQLGGLIRLAKRSAATLDPGLGHGIGTSTGESGGHIEILRSGRTSAHRATTHREPAGVLSIECVKCITLLLVNGPSGNSLEITNESPLTVSLRVKLRLRPSLHLRIWLHQVSHHFHGLGLLLRSLITKDAPGNTSDTTKNTSQIETHFNHLK